MTTDDALKRIAEEIETAKPVKKATKTNRTLSLETANFVALQTYCREHGVKVSEVLDRLIASFLETTGKKPP
jgi:hypothetical protein